MILGFIYLNILIFAALSALHVYWAVGGQWALAASIPSTSTGEKLFNPGRVGTWIVALGLLAFALLTYLHLNNFYPAIAPYLNQLTLGIAFIFLMRTVGDFKYIGLFKKVKGTPFAKQDTKIYIPLCFYLAMSCLLIVIL